MAALATVTRTIRLGTLVASMTLRNPAQLRPGGVLLVGAANSGAEIAVELARSHPIWLSGRHPGHVPFNIEGAASRLFLSRLVARVVFHRLATVDKPLGRKMRQQTLAHGLPLVRTKPNDLAAAGVERVPRVTGVRDGLPLLADGRVLEAANVIWCIGYEPGFDWIDLPVLGADGPRHERGVVAGEPGLYFVGLHFLYAASSTMIHGVARDAEYIVQAIHNRAPRARPATGTEPRRQPAAAGAEGRSQL